MNSNLLFTQKINIFVYSMILLGITLGTLMAIVFENVIVLPITLISLSMVVLFLVRPTWLFYFFMLFFVFGEIGIGQFFVQLSLSNGFGVIALLIIILYGLSGKRIHRLTQVSEQKNLLLGLVAILVVEIISAILNTSFRPLTTRLSHIISVMFVLLVIRDKEIIWRGFSLGIVSIGVLSALTILAGFDLNPFGYRASYNWGSTPLETYIPRSIGLANMGVGLHGIYILAFLPLAILMVTSGNKFTKNWWIKPVSSFAVVSGVFALLIASYRSAWVGLIVSLLSLLLLRYKSSRIWTRGKLLVSILIIGTAALILFFFGQSLYSYTYNLIFNVRSQGVEARLIQYQFIFAQILSPSLHLLFGYGYDNFGSAFMDYAWWQGFNNPEIYPWIHSYYFGLLYASGWVGFILFFTLIFKIMRNNYRQPESTDYNTRILNSAIFSGLAGIFATLMFTAETSGLHIIWILIAASTLVNKNVSNIITHRK